jgi:isoleucyl-tRNA synthetase
VPDHPRIEEAILELWEQAGTFEKLRAANRGGPRFSFIDGPVTANKAMGVHTAWGRTLKDVVQRYKALQGYDAETRRERGSSTSRRAPDATTSATRR